MEPKSLKSPYCLFLLTATEKHISSLSFPTQQGLNLQKNRGFNSHYIKYCDEGFSGRNGSETYGGLEQQILRAPKKK